MKNLAIVGTGPDTREQAPFDDDSFDIWVFNEAANATWCKRWTALLQMHQPNLYKGHNTKDPLHWDWLQERHGKPIYMECVDPQVPDSVEFPLQAALDLVGVRYISSTICYALALAVLQGYERVDVYGVQMSWTEYQYQAEAYRFWVGFLKGRGIEVNLYSSAHLFDALLYGYEGNFAFTSEYFQTRAALLDKEWQQVESNLKAQKAGIERAVKLRKTQALSALVRDCHETATRGGELSGALYEAERYATFGERFADRGGFEYAAAKAQRDGEEKRAQFLMTAGKVEYVAGAWEQQRDPKAQQFAANQLLILIEAVVQQAYDMGAYRGVYQENIGYLNKYDDMLKAWDGTTF